MKKLCTITFLSTLKSIYLILIRRYFNLLLCNSIFLLFNLILKLNFWSMFLILQFNKLFFYRKNYTELIKLFGQFIYGLYILESSNWKSFIEKIRNSKLVGGEFHKKKNIPNRRNLKIFSSKIWLWNHLYLQRLQISDVLTIKILLSQHNLMNFLT